MSNTIIMYTGNVGSTPLVQLAGRHPRIFTPVNEEFDAHRFTKTGSDNPDCKLLAEIWDRMFARESHPFLDDERIRAWRDTDALPSLSERPHLLFKWRNNIPSNKEGKRRLREVLVRHKVKPVLLARSSVVRQALKVHLSEDQYGSRHQQHHISALTAEEYEDYLRHQKTVSIRLGDSALEGCRAIAKNFLARTKDLYLATTALFDTAPRLILSEQFLRPELDYEKTSVILSHLLDNDIRLSPDMKPKVRRGGLQVEHCANPEVVAQDRTLRQIEHRYQTLLHQLSLVSGRFDPIPLANRIKAVVSPPVVPLTSSAPHV